MNFLTTLLTAFILILAPTLTLAAEDIDRIISNLQKRYDQITSLEADFTQEAVSKALKKPNVSVGRAWFKKPGKMRWSYTKPVSDEIVSNGKKLWFYQPDLNQVVESHVVDGAAGIGTDFLTGVGNLKRDFNASLESSSDSSYRISLVPKVPQQNIQRVVLVAERDFFVDKIIVIDHFGGQTRVRFENVKINPLLKDSLFEFTPPKGAAIVK